MSDPSSVNVPRDEWEELLGVVKRSRKCPGVSHDQDCDPSDHDTWIANRARALVDAAERPGAAIIEAQDAAVANTFAAPVGEPLCRCGHPVGHRGKHAPVPVSDEAEAVPGIDPNVWEAVDTHAEWVKVPTEDAGCVAGKYLRRAARQEDA